MFTFPQGIPAWVRPVLGVALVALGAVLAFHSSASISLFVVLVASGLVVVGIVRFIEAVADDHDHVSRWVIGASGVALAGIGVAALAWRGATLPILAMGVAIGLLANAGASLFSLFRAGPSAKIPAVLGGLASLTAGALVLAWPKLTVWAFGVFFGGWLFFVGLRLVIDFLARHRTPGPDPAGNGGTASPGLPDPRRPWCWRPPWSW